MRHRALESLATVSGLRSCSGARKKNSMLSYLHTFRSFGTVFLVLLPLVFLMRRPAHGGPAAPVH
jgi:hypothetical protein